MANTFLVSHILLLFHLPKGPWNKSAKYEKLGKYWSYCTRNRAVTNAYMNKTLPTLVNEEEQQQIKFYEKLLGELIFLQATKNLKIFYFTRPTGRVIEK